MTGQTFSSVVSKLKVEFPVATQKQETLENILAHLDQSTTWGKKHDGVAFWTNYIVTCHSLGLPNKSAERKLHCYCGPQRFETPALLSSTQRGSGSDDCTGYLGRL